MGGPEPLPEGMMTMRHLSDELPHQARVKVRVRVRVRVRVMASRRQCTRR